MKVIHVNTYDLQGGAARASFRLHKALLGEGIDSHMYVQRKQSDCRRILITKNPLQQILALAKPALDQRPVRRYKDKSQTLFSPSIIPGGDAVKEINKLNPDIVHLHWICKSFLRIEDIKKIKSPIVWSLHDMWPFTGGCHVNEQCEKYKEGCHTCPILKSDKKKDLSYRVFNRKKESFNSIRRLNIVGLSRWITKGARESSLFKDRQIVNLPNPLDVDQFKPIEKRLARNILNLNPLKKIILFNEMDENSDPRKGFCYLKDALWELNVEDIELVIIGKSKPEAENGLNFLTHYIGQIHDDISLKVIYSAADLVIVPSLQENLSNTIMESLSCGTPVVAFNIGGNPDMITHLENGYLAQEKNSSDLATGLEWVLKNRNSQEVSKKARSKVLESFNSYIIAAKYIELYKNILDFNN